MGSSVVHGQRERVSKGAVEKSSRGKREWFLNFLSDNVPYRLNLDNVILQGVPQSAALERQRQPRRFTGLSRIFLLT